MQLIDYKLNVEDYTLVREVLAIQRKVLKVEFGNLDRIGYYCTEY